MSDKITVLIPTSPIPAHPSTEIIDETIENTRKYTDARIIIMCDGVHPLMEHRRKDYAEYLDKLFENVQANKYGDCQAINFGTHSHQAIMTRETLKRITTPLVLFCEHDTSPIGDIPFDQICDMVIQPKNHVNCIRFNIFEKIPKEHMHLMISEPVVVDGIRLVRTIQWSQRPHVARSEWYRNILSTKHFEADKRTMIEDVMHGHVQTAYERNEGFDIYRLAIYTPEGNQLRSYHSDARKDDIKIIEG